MKKIFTATAALCALLAVNSFANNTVIKKQGNDVNDPSFFTRKLRTVKAAPIIFETPGKYLEYKRKQVMEGEDSARAYVKEYKREMVDDYLSLGGGTLSGALNIETGAGGPLIYVKEAGSGYANGNAAIVTDTDNPNGYQNYGFQSRVQGTNTFWVRSDGEGYFAHAIGIGTNTPGAHLHINAGSARLRVQENGSGTSTYLTANQLYTTGGELHLNTTSADNIYMVNGGGNVGIGTTSPGAKLDVNGVVKTSSKFVIDDSYSHAEIATTPWGASHGLFFGAKVDYTGTGNLWDAGNTKYTQGAGGYEYGAFSMGLIGNGGRFGFYDGGVSTGPGNAITWNPVMIIKRGGNIGIGSTEPSSKLSVYENGSSVNLWKGRVDFGGDNARIVAGEYNNTAYLGAHNTSLTAWANLAINAEGGNVGIGTKDPSSGLTVKTEGSNYTDGSYFLVNSPNAGFGGAATIAGIKSAKGDAGDYNLFKIQNASGNKLIISGDGSIGIGAAVQPGFMLAVKGDAKVQKLKITITDWSDYVFAPTYKLPTLTEVEDYINKYKHLPDVPSAETVTREGLDVGGNQAILLKKIEELTLYTIEQDKKWKETNRQLEEDNKKAKKVNEELMNRLEKLEKLINKASN